MPTKLDLTVIRVALGIIVYLAMRLARSNAVPHGAAQQIAVQLAAKSGVFSFSPPQAVAS